MKFIIRWLVTTVAILLAAYVLPGVDVDGFLAALITALVLGIINVLIKPVLLLLTLPINVMTLGLFTFVLNALLILLVSAVVPGFAVAGFIWALLFSLVLAVISWILYAVVPGDQ